MNKNDERLKLFISCHKPTELIASNVLVPIQVGAKNAKSHLDKMLRDDKGDNISELNPKYCEMTAQYYAWKNIDLDYYGFCHYRRYFNFAKKRFIEDEYGNIVESYPNARTMQKYGLDDATIVSLIKKYDIIIPERKDLRRFAEPSNSVRDHYKKASHLHVKDYDVMIKIIDEKYPEYSKAAHEFTKGFRMCFCNMYILKKELFFEYAEFVFGVLESFCKQVDMDLYDTEALRTPGHLAERLFNIFLLKKEKEEPQLRIKELQTVYFEETEPQELLKPAFNDKKNTIPIVFAADNSYMAVFATCLQSLIEHLNLNYNYDVVLIQTDVNDSNKKILSEMCKPYKNLSLRFFNATKLISGYELKANAHISKETYYRFLIQDVLPEYEKVLYLDCDLVINGDISELYETDIKEYTLAATRDPDFLGQINGANKETIEYTKTDFRMKNPYNYFQAGVLLFNEDKMRKKHDLNEWLELASIPHMYNDQDVLNLECENEVKYIDMKWGMIVDHDHSRVANVISYAPNEIQKEYAMAHKNPMIIHYAGFKKPWYDPTEDYAQEFWKYARKTIYYEELLQHITKFWLKNEKKQNELEQRRIKRKIKDDIIKMYFSVFPYGSKRWRTLRRLRGKTF